MILLICCLSRGRVEVSNTVKPGIQHSECPSSYSASSGSQNYASRSSRFQASECSSSTWQVSMHQSPGVQHSGNSNLMYTSFESQGSRLQSFEPHSSGFQSLEPHSSGLHSSGLHSSGLHSSGLQSSGLQSSGLQSSGLQSASLQSSGSQGSGLPATGLEGGKAQTCFLCSQRVGVGKEALKRHLQQVHSHSAIFN